MLKLRLPSALLSAISLCLGINGCATLPAPPDIFVFERLDTHLSIDPVTGHQILAPSPTCMQQIQEMSCGHGVSIMTGAEIYVGDAAGHGWKNKTWTELKQESVHLPAVESYAPLSTYMINACAKFKCNANLDAFRVKINSLNGIVGALSN